MPAGQPADQLRAAHRGNFDLDGTVDFGAYHLYNTSFVATGTTTNVSFAFREDPAFLFLDDVSVTQGGGSNLLLNPGFKLGPTVTRTRRRIGPT